MAEAKWRRHFWSSVGLVCRSKMSHRAALHNNFYAEWESTSCIILFFTYSVRKLLQQPIDAWQFLQHLLYQSTAVKKANAPGLTWKYHYTNMLHLCRSYPSPGCVASGVDLYDCYFQFFHFLCEFWINLVFFQITSQCVNVSMHLGLGIRPTSIGFFLSTFIVDIYLDTLF